MLLSKVFFQFLSGFNNVKRITSDNYMIFGFQFLSGFNKKVIGFGTIDGQVVFQFLSGFNEV